MAEAILRSFDKEIEVVSAGIIPESEVSPLTIEVLKEIGIDVSGNRPKSVMEFISHDFDYVFTLSEQANKELPRFEGTIKNRWHLLFDDPAEATGSYLDRLAVYRRVRDEIHESFDSFYRTQIKGERGSCCS